MGSGKNACSQHAPPAEGFLRKVPYKRGYSEDHAPQPGSGKTADEGVRISIPKSPIRAIAARQDIIIGISNPYFFGILFV